MLLNSRVFFKCPKTELANRKALLVEWGKTWSWYDLMFAVNMILYLFIKNDTITCTQTSLETIMTWTIFFHNLGSAAQRPSNPLISLTRQHLVMYHQAFHTINHFTSQLTNAKIPGSLFNERVDNLFRGRFGGGIRGRSHLLYLPSNFRLKIK